MTAGRVEGAQVVIVGGGVEGLAVAWALTVRGVRDVLVLERHSLAGAATAKSSGVVRCHYGVPSVAAMAWKGLQLLESAVDVLDAEVGFHRTGYVVAVGGADVAALAANVALGQRLGIEVELIDAETVSRLWPGMRLEDFAAFAYEPRGGYGDGAQTAFAFAAAARRGGAALRQHAAVAAIETDRVGRVSGVRLADGERIGAATVVVAAGSWTAELLAPLGFAVPIKAQREAVLLVDAGMDARQLPVFSDLVDLQYLRSERSGQLLVGNSDHRCPDWADPDDYLNVATDGQIATAAAKLSRRFPDHDVRLASSYAGCYDVTPDYNPIIGPAGPSGLMICAGFSGHGYKISPAVGELMADLILDGTSRDPRIPGEDFSLDRFQTGRLLASAHPYATAGQMR
jgi:sarcosine oxidase subunit beta